MIIQPRVLLACFGDNQYHDHAKIGAFLNGWLGDAGFPVTFTADPGAVTTETLDRHDVVVMYAVNASLPAQQLEPLLEAVHGARPNDRGNPVGLVGLHGVTTSFRDNAEWQRLIGASFVTHPDMGPAYRFFVKDPSHPVTRGVENFNLKDELYLFDVHAPFDVLLTCLYEDVERPVAWHKSYGRGRVFYLALGHDVAQLGDTRVRRLIENGIRWLSGTPDKEGGRG